MTKENKKLEKKYLEMMNKVYSGDEEADHEEADYLLLELLTELGMKDLVRAFNNIPKWFS